MTIGRGRHGEIIIITTIIIIIKSYGLGECLCASALFARWNWKRPAIVADFNVADINKTIGAIMSCFSLLAYFVVFVSAHRD